MSWVILDEMTVMRKEHWDYITARMMEPVYKNRGVKMPPEYGQQGQTLGGSLNTASYEPGGNEEVYVNGKYLTRHDVAAAQQAFARKEHEREQRRLEEQKKKDEEAKRQATIALRASKHMTRRTLHGASWLLLDPVTVRKALDRADKYGGMVSLSSIGSMLHDEVESLAGTVDAPVGTYTFLSGAK